MVRLALDRLVVDRQAVVLLVVEARHQVLRHRPVPSVDLFADLLVRRGELGRSLSTSDLERLTALIDPSFD